MADRSGMTSTGGQTVAVVAVSGVTNAQVYTGAGRLCTAQVLTAGITNSRVWDAAATTGIATSNLVYTFAQTTVVGTLIDLQIPFSNGLVFERQAGGPGVRLSITADTVYGR